jgi:hypothetical protein
MQMVTEDRSSAAELAAFAGRDPALSATILTFANCCPLRGSDGSTDLAYCLTSIGTDLVEALAATLVVQNVHSSLFCGQEFSFSGFLGHSLRVAEVARALAINIEYPDVEGAGLAGLLHNVGQLLLLGGLMVAARVASSIAAEIGTMKVTEQIDALVTLSTNPLKYLAVPRVLAATLAVPVLVGVGDSIGIAGGWLVGITRLDFNSATYLKNTVEFLEFWDVGSGLVKGAVFGFIVALMGCYFGMNSARGAQGVGAATKSAVVTASILILGANYLLTEVFFTS